MSDWQLIETAVIAGVYGDGPDVLLFPDRHGRIVVGCWNSAGRGCWMSNSFGLMPTHWMPLPATPAKHTDQVLFGSYSGAIDL